MSLDKNMQKNGIIINRIDIRGEVCPMTFVYTKLALEELPKGSILEVLLDFPQATTNIPENCRRQNLAELIEINKINNSHNLWLLRLKKL
ncbi:MAG: sulfurtransferase TusA family protein [Candidatus Heimdallarchaeota archaeon]